MNAEIDLKDLWARQQTVMPGEQEIIAKAMALKKDIRKKSLMLAVVMLATVAGMAYIWYISNFHMFSSKAGTSLVVLAVLLAAINAAQTAFSVAPDTMITDNAAYLNQLLQLKRRQDYTQTSVMTLYFILLFLGLALYMVEPALKMSRPAMIVTCAGTFCWLAFGWFYLRPRSIKKQQAKLNSVIEKLIELNKKVREGE